MSTQAQLIISYCGQIVSCPPVVMAPSELSPLLPRGTTSLCSGAAPPRPGLRLASAENAALVIIELVDVRERRSGAADLSFHQPKIFGVPTQILHARPGGPIKVARILVSWPYVVAPAGLP